MATDRTVGEYNCSNARSIYDAVVAISSDAVAGAVVDDRSVHRVRLGPGVDGLFAACGSSAGLHSAGGRGPQLVFRVFGGGFVCGVNDWASAVLLCGYRAIAKVQIHET
jgi:hypothetical protein